MIVFISVWSEAATWGVLYKEVFLNILQYSQENTCVGVQRRCFSVNITKFLRTPIFKNICERQLRHTISRMNFYFILDEMLQMSLNFLIAIVIDLECSGSMGKNAMELVKNDPEKHLQYSEIRQWEIVTTVLHRVGYLVTDT